MITVEDDTRMRYEVRLRGTHVNDSYYSIIPCAFSSL